MSRNIHLLIIDPQVDFMDSPNSALPVTGANDDMRRLATMINHVGRKLDSIFVTLDSHRVIDVGHPAMWQDASGNQPPAFTIISSADIAAGIWEPRNKNVRLADLGNKTLGQYMLEYAQALEAGGQYPLMIWPPHCLIGTLGHNVQAELMSALLAWETREFANVDYVTKGTNVFTEHYGAVMAEVPLASDPASGLNTNLLKSLAQADMVVVAGEAASHCVKSTVTQIADNIGDEHVKKFVLLTDCMSPVLHPDIDFPSITKAWMKEMEGRGMTLTTSVEFLI